MAVPSGRTQTALPLRGSMQRRAHRHRVPYLLAEVDEADNGLVNVITHSSTSPARKTGPRPSLANTSIMAWTALLHTCKKKPKKKPPKKQQRAWREGWVL